jgi:hypothetical protein
MARNEAVTINLPSVEVYGNPSQHGRDDVEPFAHAHIHKDINPFVGLGKVAQGRIFQMIDQDWM